MSVCARIGLKLFLQRIEARRSERHKVWIAGNCCLSVKHEHDISVDIYANCQPFNLALSRLSDRDLGKEIDNSQ